MKLLPRALVKSALGAAIDFIAPPSCPCCHAPRTSARPLLNAELCAACVDGLAPSTLDHCPRCGASVGPMLDASAGCVHCSGETFAFSRTCSLGTYDAHLRNVILRLKHQVREPLAAAMIDLLLERQGERLRATGADLVLPVPRHWTHFFWPESRSAALLARRLARRLQIDFDDRTLRKIRRTSRQARLNATERRRNLRGAFAVRRGSLLTGSTVLLVDDVLTTGMTAHECAKVLRKAGAADVVVTVLARSFPR